MIDWYTISRKYGYWNTAEMLIDLYIKKKYSLTKIGDILIVSDRSVANKMRKLKIKIRPCGGANNKGGYKVTRRIVKDAT